MCVQLCVILCDPGRLLCPGDSLDKNTGLGCLGCFILFLKLIFIGVRKDFLGRKIIAGDLEKAEVI